jgi:hypothetical protein
MEPNLKLSRDNGDLVADPTMYRRLVGRLIYLTITRPDLAYSVQILNQFMDKPRQSHLAMDAAYRVLRYPKNAPGQGTFFLSSSTCQLKAFCDSDWTRCPDSRCSITGFLHGFGHFSMIYMLITIKLCFFTMIEWQPYTLQPIRFFTREPNILNWIVILFEIRF